MIPVYSQGRKALWEAINPHTGIRRIDEWFPQELRARTLDQTMTIEFINGSFWSVVGSDNYDTLVGSPPRGLVYSEWAIANPNAWGYLEPILVENGGWAIFAYTPRGKNHGYSLYNLAKRREDWYAEIMTPDKTGIFTEKQLDEVRETYIEMYGEDIGDLLFQQEYWCSFHGSMLGAYFALQIAKAEREERIRSVSYDPSLPVYTSWDIGRSDATAIWFWQESGRERYYIDYYEDNGHDYEHYANVLQKRGYNYAELIMPLDAASKHMAAKKSVAERFKEYGYKVRVLDGKTHQDIQGQINASRALLPRCYFDEQKCERGLNALRSYRKEYNEKLRRFNENPLHDWASDGATAFNTGAMMPERVKRKGPSPQPKVPVY
jgi:phage terminase large subunit